MRLTESTLINLEKISCSNVEMTKLYFKKIIIISRFWMSIIQRTAFLPDDRILELHHLHVMRLTEYSLINLEKISCSKEETITLYFKMYHFK